jgi:hypothetical protein
VILKLYLRPDLRPALDGFLEGPALDAPLPDRDDSAPPRRAARPPTRGWRPTPGITTPYPFPLA